MVAYPFSLRVTAFELRHDMPSALDRHQLAGIARWCRKYQKKVSMMARTTKRKRSSFLSSFELEDRLLRREDKKSGLPSLVEGYSDTDVQVLVKTWSASKHDNSLLREIWQHEIRQLHRICGYPGASEIIARVYSTGIDDEGFHLALDVGQRRPLAVHIEHGLRNNWLRQTNIVSNRIRLWQNVTRICEGVEILHCQGLIHRNLDTWSILTAGGEEIDFQLTGFEWSVRLTSVGAVKIPTKGSKINVATASFYSDWRDLAFLVSDLLRLDRKKISDPSVPPSSVSERLLVEEIRLLKRLVTAERIDRLDGEIIKRELEEIIDALKRSEARVEQKLRLAVRLGSQTALSEAIRKATNGEIDLQDVDAQMSFMREDLGDRPRLMLIHPDKQADSRLVVCGHTLTYSLSKFVHRVQQSEGSWDLAYCERSENKNPAPRNVISEELLPSGSIEVISHRYANKEFPRLRGKLRSWQSMVDHLSIKKSATDFSMGVIEALSLISYVDAVFAAADSFPVDVEEIRDDHSEDLFSIRVRVRVDTDREALSEALGLKSLSDRLDELVQKDSRSEEWVISDGQLVGVKEHSNTTWRLTERYKDDRGVSYRLSGSDPLPKIGQALLILSDFVGRDAQFRRRVKAINALKEHAELAELLEDPRQRILETHETVAKDGPWKELDPSKQKAFERIVSTLSINLVQGPPGVGKTRLVRDLAAHVFQSDPTSRILLSAQANSAIDHLMDEVVSEGSLPEDCLVVRPRSKDNYATNDQKNLRTVAKDVISRFCTSDVARNAPKHLQPRISALREATIDSDMNPNGRKIRLGSEIQSVEHLVLRSANVVFSTANASSIERLVEEKNQFDWSIVEEAGKANGLELVGPLLLSHRRLLIGDHKQLAPFDSHRLERLLESPDNVQQALSVGGDFVGRNLRDQTIDEVVKLAEDMDFDIAPLCSKAIGLLSLFETLIEDQIKWQNDRPRAYQLASVLLHQHRMHPTISNLVSKTFYSGMLETHQLAKDRFLNGTPPVNSADSTRLPDLPLTVVDMPYVQSALNKKYGDQPPNWHNLDEISAVTKVLKQLNVEPGLKKKPSLAVLSPYNEQVRRLKVHIDEDLDLLPNLKNFVGAVDQSFCGTVDSFQGNQADVVVVSLVRNNHRSGLSGALGFLCDARRMNVLFSRARWKLIIVTSLDFLAAVLSANEGQELVEESFLPDLLKNLESEIQAGNAARISFEELVTGVKS